MINQKSWKGRGRYVGYSIENLYLYLSFNRFDKGFHASSKGSCLLFFCAICLLVPYKDFMEDINPFRWILYFVHLILRYNILFLVGGTKIYLSLHHPSVPNTWDLNQWKKCNLKKGWHIFIYVSIHWRMC